MALKENSKNIFYYVQAHETENVTAKDIAAALGLTDKQVNGSVTAFQKKKLMERIEREIETEDGHAKIKTIHLTDAGRAFDPEAPAEVPAE